MPFYASTRNIENSIMLIHFTDSDLMHRQINIVIIYEYISNVRK